MEKRAGSAAAPVVLRDPFTREARLQALEREILQTLVDYFPRSIQYRRWSPWHDLPFDEIREYGPRLSEETVDLIEGFMGVEEHIADYMLPGLETFRGDRARRNLWLQWGAEEARHGVAFEQVLLHSGRRSEAQLHAYLADVAEKRWIHEEHPGVDCFLGVAVYATVQERITYFNYEWMRRRIREEYRLPPRVTPEERKRGTEVGAAEALRKVSLDEIGHHGVFLKIVQIHLRYFPEATLDALHQVLESFRMPAVSIIPNRRVFARAIVRSGLHKAQDHLQPIRDSILKALGTSDSRLDGAG